MGGWVWPARGTPPQRRESERYFQDDLVVRFPTTRFIAFSWQGALIEWQACEEHNPQKLEGRGLDEVGSSNQTILLSIARIRNLTLETITGWSKVVSGWHDFATVHYRRIFSDNAQGYESNILVYCASGGGSCKHDVVEE
jgi:hypothetical protein